MLTFMFISYNLFSNTYDVDELNEGKAEPHVHLLCHVLNGPDQLVVASEQVSH